MANNSLYLCDGMGNQICLAKYFPSNGWYVRNQDLARDLDDFFQKHDGDMIDPMIGNVDYRVVYEADLPAPAPTPEEAADIIAEMVGRTGMTARQFLPLVGEALKRRGIADPSLTASKDAGAQK